MLLSGWLAVNLEVALLIDDIERFLRAHLRRQAYNLYPNSSAHTAPRPATQSIALPVVRGAEQYTITSQNACVSLGALTTYCLHGGGCQSQSSRNAEVQQN